MTWPPAGTWRCSRRGDGWCGPSCCALTATGRRRASTRRTVTAGCSSTGRSASGSPGTCCATRCTDDQQAVDLLDRGRRLRQRRGRRGGAAAPLLLPAPALRGPGRRLGRARAGDRRAAGAAGQACAVAGRLGRPLRLHGLGEPGGALGRPRAYRPPRARAPAPRSGLMTRLEDAGAVDDFLRGANFLSASGGGDPASQRELLLEDLAR